MNPIHPALAPLARAAKERKGLEEALRRALAIPAWLRAEHRVGDPNAYMRHVLYVDPDNRPSIGSPIVRARRWCRCTSTA